MDSFEILARNSSGVVKTAACACGAFCAGGAWGTAGVATLTCPTGYITSTDGPYFCVKPRPVDAGQCPTPKGAQAGQPVPGETAGSKQPTGGDPIDLSSGTLLHTIPLFETGDGLLEFSFNYNSRSEFKGPAGWGWVPSTFAAYEHSYSNAWVQDISGRTMFFRNMSSVWRPRKVESGGWSNSNTLYRKDTAYGLATNGSGKFVFTDEGGAKFTFTKNGGTNTSKGVLDTRAWPDGYTQTYTYNAAGQNTQIADNRGRTMTFAYHANGLLKSVTDPDAAVYKFEYANTAGAVPTALGSEEANTAYLARIIMPDTTPLTDADNPTIQLHYDPVGAFMELVGITNERGIRVATWTYANGRPVSFEGPNGFNETTVSYDDTNNITTITTALGKQTKYKHTLVNGIPKLTEVDGVASTNCAASDTTYNLDTDGRVSRTILPEGEKIRYVRDVRGLPTTIEDGETTALSRTTTITWDATFPVPTQIVQPGMTATFSVDTLGRVLSTTYTDTTSHTAPYSTNGLTRTWAYTYLSNSGRKLATVDGPLSGTIDKVFYAYDASGNLASVTDANGFVSTINAVNGRGQPTSITEPNGTTTTFAYSPRGWVTEIIVNPGGSQRVSSFEYDGAGNLTKTTLPAGGWFTYAYTDEGLLETVTSSAGEVLEYTYDLLGNMLTETRSGGGPATFSASKVYDELGRTLRAIGASAQTTQFGYDRSDQLTSLTDPRSKLYSFGFDALNRLITSTDPDSDVERIGYSSAGDVNSFEDGGGVVTTYVHNGFGDVIRATSPDSGVTDYWYDAAGNLVKKVDAEGIEVNYGYDGGGRLVSEQFVGSTSLNRTYSYDSTAGGNKGTGRLTGIADAHGTTAIVYNAFGEVTSETRVLNSVSFTTAYAYDLNGALSTITYPSGRTVEYTHDTLGRTTAVKTRSAPGQPLLTVASSIAWKPFGPLAGYTAGNGLSASWGYDQDYQLTNISVDDGATALLNLDFTYDPAGNITDIDDTLSPSRSYSFTYTNDDRIATSTGPAESAAWTYDGGGNRTQEVRAIGASTLTENYVYAASSNRVTQLQDATSATLRQISYDDKGQITLDDRTSGPDFEYIYDADSRLVAVEKNGSPVATYGYDAWGSQVIRETLGSPALSRLYIYDEGGLPLVETDGTGATLREYIWMDGRLIGLTIGAGSGSTLNFVHGGRFAEPLRMTSGSKSVVWDVDMEPFGQVGQVTATVDLDSRLPGQWEQFETGLYQNWWRNYDPTLGRYIQPDRLGLGGGSNPYNYANQNPLSYFDPDGQNWVGPALTFMALSGLLDALTDRLKCQLAGTPLGAVVEAISIANDVAGLWSLRSLPKLAAKGLPAILPKMAKGAPKPPRVPKIPDTLPKGKYGAGGAGCGCFVAGTLVATPDGLKPIEEIKVGDLVMAWDEKTGDVSPRAVTDLIRPEPKSIWRLTTKDGGGEIETFDVTADHPWYVKSAGWTETKDLNVSEQIETADKRGLTVLSIALTDSEKRTYNLTVEGLHTFLVGNDGAVVHNCLRGLGRAPKKGAADSMYEQVDRNGKVRSRTFYDSNGNTFARQDFDHVGHGVNGPHEHLRTFDAAGRPITGEVVRPLPPGYN